MNRGSPHLQDVRIVTVFGGTGFLGRVIVDRLLSAGLEVRLACRRPYTADTVPPTDGRPISVYADVRDEASVEAAISGADAVVNAVGLYVETAKDTFADVHQHGARTVARRASACGVRHLVHLSGIGADVSSPSAYVRSRAQGERAVCDAFPAATVLRPSAVFAADDNFIALFARLVRSTPVIPLFGRGQTRMQPVHAGDVGSAVVAALQTDAEGKVFELGGPEVFTYRDLIMLVADRMDRRPILVPVPFAIWEVLAFLCKVLPRPPITKAHVTLMRQDNAVGETALSFADLGIEPVALSAILADYLRCHTG